MDRRGNTIVLVAGILVLLVIIATSYLTRTQSQRVVSVARNESHNIDAAAGVIAESVAEELALQLFTWPIDPEIFNDLVNTYGPDEAEYRIRDANWPRLHPSMYSQVHGRYDTAGNFYPLPAHRYNIDDSPAARDDGRSFPFNHAPFHTIAWTNWPDPDSLGWDGTLWPAGPGNLFEEAGNLDGSGLAGNLRIFSQGLLASEYNALGNPGFGDNRLLADFEPMRYVYPSGTFAGMEVFTHWRKLTNLAHANNVWRVIGDTADVDANTVHDLNIPVEQWLSQRPFNVFTGTTNSPHQAGNANITLAPPGLPGPNGFLDLWQQWFGLSEDRSYAGLYSRPVSWPNPNDLPLASPPNFINIRNPNASLNPHDDGELPQDEFVFNSFRNRVSRVLADADGDGFTDSFWFTTPIPTRNGIRTIAAVRIIDNSAMLNVNTAGRFQPWDDPNDGTYRLKTRGHTPTDIAAVAELNSGDVLNHSLADQPPFTPPGATDWPPIENWHVGLFDNPANWLQTQNFSNDEGPLDRWADHLIELGIITTEGDPLMFPEHIDRLDYWRLAGRLGFNEPVTLPSTALYPLGDPTYRPYALADEIKLRMFHGNSHPWIFSRLESTLQSSASGGNDSGILRAGMGNEESSEYLDQLTNNRLVRDLRRLTTAYNGARNDLLPPWLIWEHRYPATLAEGLCGPTGVNDKAVHPNLPPEMYEILACMCRPMCAGAPETDTAEEWAAAAYARYEAQSRRKLDLREPDSFYYEYIFNGLPDYHPADVHHDAGRLNFADRLAPMLLLALTDDVSENGLHPNRIYGSYYGPFSDPESGLTEIAEEWDPIDGSSLQVDAQYYFDAQSPLNMTRRLAAAWASNIRAYRHNEPVTVREDRVDLPTYGVMERGHPGIANAINPPGVVQPITRKTAYMPIDPQPFIVEAFIGHVYKPSETVPNEFKPTAVTNADCENPIPPGIAMHYGNSGSPIILDRGDDDPYRSAIVVVQIANPFDVPINLRDYRLRVMGQGDPANPLSNTVELASVIPMGTSPWLEPARDGKPSTAIFYAMRDSLSGDPDKSLRGRWLDFLDIEITDQMPTDPNRAGDLDENLAPGTLVLNIGAATPQTNRIQVWTRLPYDDPSSDRSVTLERLDPSFGAPTWVTVDRLDAPAERDLREQVKEMAMYRPMTHPSSLDDPLPLCRVMPEGGVPGGDFPTYEISPEQHWVQWVRATRAWGVDLNGNGAYEAHERNPRYVFGDRAIVVPTWRGTPDAATRFSRRRILTTDAFGLEINSELPVPANDDLSGANTYVFGDDPDGATITDPPWFARSYYNSYGDLVDGQTESSGRTPGYNAGDIIPQRKPTFFSLGWKEGAQWNPTGTNPVDSHHASRSYFMPDKGWYGQFKVNLREAVAAGGMTPALFRTVGVGWGLPGVDSGAAAAEPPTSGVDDPPILYNSLGLWDGSTLTWSEPALPLFRQPYSMRMTLKSKRLPSGYDSSYSSLTDVQLDEIRLTRDFEQVGELLNVWLFGHEIRYELLNPTTGEIDPTTFAVVHTFAEHMSGTRRQGANGEYLWMLVGGTPAFDVPDPDSGALPYDRYRDWLADPEKNRINRVRTKPWKFHAYPTNAATESNDPFNAKDNFAGMIIGRPRIDSNATNQVTLYNNDPRHGVPALPAGVRVLDAFVCDGPGDVRWDNTIIPGGDWVDSLGNQIGFEGRERRKFYNANGFTGKATPGLININTAPREVLRTLPHMTRIVHEDWSLGENPFPQLSRAMIRYRERFGDPTTATHNFGAAHDVYDLTQGPAYAHRGRDRDWFRPGETVQFRAFLNGARGDRGMASIGELTLLTQSGRIGKIFGSGPDADRRFYDTSTAPADPFDALDFNSSWRIDYASMPERKPFEIDVPAGVGAWTATYLYRDQPGGANLPDGVLDQNMYTSYSAQISTDVLEEFDDRDGFSNTPGYLPGLHPDLVAEDAQESNLLFSGLSNLVTTRSDVFTVYFRVRSFRQNPITGVWDATDPDYIVEDSRYVMLVDRSEVNTPNDKPKILYLEKLPK